MSHPAPCDSRPTLTSPSSRRHLSWPWEGSALFRRLLMVAFFVEVGLLLIVVPWSSFWDRNYFGALWPPLRPWLHNDYVRGAVSGLGFVNLIAGIADLLPIVWTRAETGAQFPDHAGTEGPS